MAYQFYNPERIYLNVGASALASSYSLSTDPEATYQGDRSQPVVGNLKNYKLSVVRASLQGQRNFPLYIPTVQLGQSDPYLTTLGLTINASWSSSAATYTAVAPSASANPNWRTTVYDASGNVYEYADTPIGYSNNVSPPSPPGTTPSSWAAAISACYFSLASNSYYTTVARTQASVSGSNQLQFGLNLPVGFSFSIAPNPVVMPPWQDACPILGFPYGGNVSNEIFSNVSTDPTQPCVITLPYPCSYTYAPPGPASLHKFASSVFLEWEAQTTDAPTPAAPITQQDINAVAYWMYDYTWFVRILNKALTKSWQAVITQAALTGYTLFGDAPYCAYVPGRQSFTLTWNSIVQPNTDPSQPSASLVLNEQLANLVVWPATYLRKGDATIIWDDATISTDGAYTITSNYPATANAWSPISSLVFQSSTLPVRAEITSPTTQWGSQGSTPGSNADTSQILSDVIPAFTDAADWNANIVLYSPTVLRWIDLNDMSGALTNLNFSVLWRNAITGDILPVVLNPTASFSVKILLQRKDIPF